MLLTTTGRWLSPADERYRAASKSAVKAGTPRRYAKDEPEFKSRIGLIMRHAAPVEKTAKESAAATSSFASRGSRALH